MEGHGLVEEDKIVEDFRMMLTVDFHKVRKRVEDYYNPESQRIVAKKEAQMAQIAGTMVVVQMA